jgi:hypothetical protein
MTLQALDENPDTWGTVLNDSALQLLEDGIAATGSIDITVASDYTLDDTAGGPTATTGARNMILDLFGSPGGARNVIVPTRSKVYLVANTSDGDVTVKTVAGTGPVVTSSEAQWVYCDGTDVQAATVGLAVNAQNAVLAADSVLLNGAADTDFAKLAGTTPFTAGQVSTRVPVLIEDTDKLKIDTSLSNSFYHLTTIGFTLNAPTSGVNGQQFSLVVEQGTGAPHGITFLGNTFIGVGGVPTLSTTFGSIDYLGFEYVTGLDDLGGARWMVSLLKGLGPI